MLRNILVVLFSMVCLFAFYKGGWHNGYKVGAQYGYEIGSYSARIVAKSLGSLRKTVPPKGIVPPIEIHLNRRDMKCITIIDGEYVICKVKKRP